MSKQSGVHRAVLVETDPAIISPPTCMSDKRNFTLLTAMTEIVLPQPAVSP
jgi:hypothetical protein